MLRLIDESHRMDHYILTSITGRTYRRVSRGEAMVYVTGDLCGHYIVRHISDLGRRLKMSDLLQTGVKR